jgi:sugar/nucleoside kinase (ribokinase family)
MFDILVAGEINPDLILTGNVEPVFGQAEKLVAHSVLTIGSSSVIFACGAARLGLRVGFIGKCGDDLFGRYMLAQMSSHNIDIANVIVVAGEPTGLSVILNRGDDRAILTYPGLMADLRNTDISDRLLQQARHLHIASYFLQTALQPDLPNLFERAHNYGLTTSLDPNFDPSEKWSGFEKLLAITDVFLPNETEIKSLTGVDTVDTAVARLSPKVDTLAVKLGAAGALGARHGCLARVPTLPVAVKDTVGAGDSFDAGFIYGFLHAWPLERSLRLGTVCGALSTQKPGGTAAQPGLAEATGYLAG